MSGWRGWVDRLLGRGGSSVTVPTLDGPLLPNTLLEEAQPLLALGEPDNLVAFGEGVLFSSGADLRSLDPAGPSGSAILRTVAGPITALASSSGGALAIAVEGTGVVLTHPRSDERTIPGGAIPAACVTALAWLSPTTLAIAVGARDRLARDWRRDLMENGRSGSVWILDVGSGSATCLARDLAWPGGLAATPAGGLFVSEAWRHRVLALGSGSPSVALADLPAYPGRIVPATGGGFWLACPTIRNQLVEFILREPAYLKRMLAEVPEPYWMAPTLVSGLSFKEPMQGSALKQMGILKPWSATRSYGLVVRCDTAMQPLRSYHARADGHLHGVTSVCEWQDVLLVGARGAGEIVSLPGACEGAARDWAA